MRLTTLLITGLIAGTAFSQDLYKVRVNKLEGFIDKAGKIAIAPTYDKVNEFSEGLASFKKGAKYGFINASGKVVIAAKFDRVTKFSEGLAAVKSV